MTLDRFRPYTTRLIDPAVSGFDRLGFTPDGVSFLAFVLAIGAGMAFALGGQVQPLWYGVGVLLVGLSGWLDVVDGALARAQEAASAGGDLLDHVLDRYADIVLIAGLAAGVGNYVLGFAAVTGVVMTSYLGTQSQAVGLERTYGGIVGRADRIVLITIAAIVSVVYPFGLGPLTVVGWLLVVFAIVGHLTAIQRFYYARRALDSD